MTFPFPSQAPKYPPGAILRCPCGREGPVRNVVPHWAHSNNPICRTVSRLHVVGEDPEPEAALEQMPEGSEASATTDAIAPVVSAAPFGTAAYPPRTQFRPVSTGRRPRGAPSLEVRQPGRAPYGMLPDPTTVRGNLELSFRAWGYYEAALFDPELAFEGTMPEFIDAVFEAFFYAIGYEGIRLVKRPLFAVAGMA